MTAFHPPARWRTLPVRLMALVALALTPVWYRLSVNTPIFGAGDVSRYTLFVPTVLTVLLWLLLGMPGLRRLFSSVSRAAWAACLIALAFWAYASGAWAYTGELRPAVAEQATLIWAVTVGYALAVAAVGLPARWVVLVMGFGLLWNGILAGQQVAAQGSAGGLWAALKEFPIGVEQPRISVVMADGVRWLRPYGLLPHPNFLAGFLAVALVAFAPALTVRRWSVWLISAVVWSVGLWALMLTFSRGAYLAFAVGGALLLILLWRAGRWNKPLLVAAVLTVALGVLFLALYHPFLLARAGIGSENTELYSLGERAMLNAAAADGIRSAPLVGVGVGNLPWYSARWLFDRQSPILGNYPHNAALTMWGDLGLIGLGLWAGAVGAALVGGFRHLRQNAPDRAWRAALLAGFVVWLFSGLTEYAPTSLFHSMVLGWGVAAAALAPPDRPMLES